MEGITISISVCGFDICVPTKFAEHFFVLALTVGSVDASFECCVTRAHPTP